MSESYGTPATDADETKRAEANITSTEDTHTEQTKNDQVTELTDAAAAAAKPETKEDPKSNKRETAEHKEKKDGTTLKIRKRTIEGNSAPRSGFSMRQRGQAEVGRGGPPSARGSPAPSTTTSANASPAPAPYWAAKPKPSSKPAWMKDEDYNLVHNEYSEPAAPPTAANELEPKLKKPSRRGNADDQVRRAQVERQREDQAERRAQEERRNDELVKRHYNQRAYVAKHSKRFRSPIIKLRNFNNAIKYMLIGNHSQPGWRVLDLGCGKGGDINKWSMAEISEYIGIDISNASIVEAIKRYNKIHAGFDVTFITGDCFGQPLPYLFRDFQHIRLPVDIVSMQFCMHYAFETEEKARTLIENVSRSLRPGGIFIGTIPSSDFITEKLAKLPPGEKKFGNSIYSVTFENDPPRDGNFRPAYGQMYTYYLQDAIDNVPEYVVPFGAFRALADEFGLKLTYKKTFLEMFKEEIPTWFRKLNTRLVEGMRRSDGTYGVEGDESEASAFYLAFAFEKS